MVTRRIIATTLAVALLATTPAYADAQPGAKSGTSGISGSMPQIQRGKFSHRKRDDDHYNHGGLLLLGTAAGLAGLIAGLSGGGGAAPPVSGQ